jgi:hypothetical protein
MYPSVIGFIYGFSMMVLHHVTVVKCVNSCTKIILDAGLVVDMKLQFPARKLTQLIPLDFCLWGYLRAKYCVSTVDTREELWCQV